MEIEICAGKFGVFYFFLNFLPKEGLEKMIVLQLFRACLGFGY